MSRDELLGGDDIDAFVMGHDQVEAAQIAHANNRDRAPSEWVPADDDTPHRFGPLAAIAERLRRIA